MPSVIISGEVFDRLAKRAAGLNVTVEQLIAPLLDLAADGGIQAPAKSPIPASFDDWKKSFDTWMADVQKRIPRYPPGFELDDSRESIYGGCGE